MAGCGRPDQVNPLFPIKRLPCKFRVNVRQMRPNESRENDAVGCFRTTHWSVVLLSAQTQVPGSQTALAALCRLYWYPLYPFVRRRGYNAADAQTLTPCNFSSLSKRKE